MGGMGRIVGRARGGKDAAPPRERAALAAARLRLESSPAREPEPHPFFLPNMRAKMLGRLGGSAGAGGGSVFFCMIVVDGAGSTGLP